MTSDPVSTKKTAKTAGRIYLLLAITGAFNLLYFQRAIIVAGDAAATVNNIASSELLFRSATFSGLVAQAIFIFLVLVLYRLLKEVNQKQAVLMVALVIVSAATGVLTTLNQMAPLVFMRDSVFSSVFEQAQRDALVYAFLRLHGQVVQGIQIFWGLWLFPFGLLVIKSRFIPKTFGILLIIAGCGYVLSSFISVVLPQFKGTIGPLVMLLELGELPIIFWLLIVGAKTQSAQPGVLT